MRAVYIPNITLLYFPIQTQFYASNYIAYKILDSRPFERHGCQCKCGCVETPHIQVVYQFTTYIFDVHHFIE